MGSTFSSAARSVTRRLQEEGFKAFIVGGAVLVLFAWHEVSGKRIESHIGDISEGTFIADTATAMETGAVGTASDGPSGL